MGILIMVITGINFISMIILFAHARKMARLKDAFSSINILLVGIQTGFMTCIGIGVLILLVLSGFINL